MNSWSSVYLEIDKICLFEKTTYGKTSFLLSAYEQLVHSTMNSVKILAGRVHSALFDTPTYLLTNSWCLAVQANLSYFGCSECWCSLTSFEHICFVKGSHALALLIELNVSTVVD